MTSFEDLSDERFHILSYLSFDDQVSLSLVCKELYQYIKNRPCLWVKIDMETFLRMCDFELPILPEHLRDRDDEQQIKVYNHLVYILLKDNFEGRKNEKIISQRFIFGLNRIDSTSVKSIEIPSYSNLFFQKLPEMCPLLEELLIRIFPEYIFTDRFGPKPVKLGEPKPLRPLHNFDVDEIEIMKKMKKMKRFILKPYEYSNDSRWGRFMVSEEFIKFLQDQKIKTNMIECVGGKDEEEEMEHRKGFHCYSTLIRCEKYGSPLCHVCWRVIQEKTMKTFRFSMLGYCDVCHSGCYCGIMGKKADDVGEVINEDAVPHCSVTDCMKMACVTCCVERKYLINRPSKEKEKR